MPNVEMAILDRRRPNIKNLHKVKIVQAFDETFVIWCSRDLLEIRTDGFYPNFIYSFCHSYMPKPRQITVYITTQLARLLPGPIAWSSVPKFPSRLVY